jgi:hypothetical protein
MTELREADYRIMAEVCFEAQRRDFDLPWRLPEPRARLLRSAWYCVFHPDQRATARAAAEDADIAWGTVSAWLSREKRGNTFSRLGDVLKFALDMPPAPGSIIDVIADANGKPPAWATEIVEKFSGDDRVWAEIERMGQGFTPDWSFLDGLPATTIDFYQDFTGSEDWTEDIEPFAKAFVEAKTAYEQEQGAEQ